MPEFLSKTNFPKWKFHSSALGQPWGPSSCSLHNINSLMPVKVHEIRPSSSTGRTPPSLIPGTSCFLWLFSDSTINAKRYSTLSIKQNQSRVEILKPAVKLHECQGRKTLDSLHPMTLKHWLSIVWICPNLSWSWSDSVLAFEYYRIFIPEFQLYGDWS